VLCDRFEHELEQQREKVAESVKESATSGGGKSGDGGAVAKRKETAMRKGRTTTQTVQDAETPGVSSHLALRRRQEKRRSGRRWRMLRIRIIFAITFRRGFRIKAY
jgi:hypothetical protein